MFSVLNRLKKFIYVLKAVFKKIYKFISVFKWLIICVHRKHCFLLKIKFFLSTKTGELNIFSRLYERFRIKYFFILSLIKQATLETKTLLFNYLIF
jgi:hypothetical protein